MPIHHTKEGRIAKINIDCPPVNAIDSTQWLNLYHIINDLSEDKSVNVILITASGKVFVAELIRVKPEIISNKYRL